jgi:hypothetical protein
LVQGARQIISQRLVGLVATGANKPLHQTEPASRLSTA